MFDLKLRNTLSQRQNSHQLRNYMQIEPANQVAFISEGKSYLSFATNDYLGLANHPQVILACQQALHKYGVGSGSAYLITGYGNAHRELEEHLAEFLHYPRVLVFSCGYMANLGIISALFSSADYIFADKLNHASLLDGCLASKAKLQRYPHRDMASLSKLCAKTVIGNKLLVTEGVFGMDGTLGHLNQLASLAKQHHSMLMVDDAHGIGVLGIEGRGAMETFNLNATDVPILTGTFGKAFGVYGAFIASNDLIVESLKQLCRTYIYTTATPPAIAAATLASLKIIQTEKWRREKLQELIRYFHLCAEQLGIPPSLSPTPIQPILIGDNKKSLAVSEYLLSKGIIVKAIRPPTVPHASARLRITLTVEHSKQQLDFLLENLAYALKIC